jgi:hypothetical protein
MQYSTHFDTYQRVLLTVHHSILLRDYLDCVCIAVTDDVL